MTDRPTASRWLPPLRLMALPEGADLTAAFARCIEERGSRCILPADCKIEIVEGGPARTLKPRTTLGLMGLP